MFNRRKKPYNQTSKQVPFTYKNNDNSNKLMIDRFKSTSTKTLVAMSLATSAITFGAVTGEIDTAEASTTTLGSMPSGSIITVDGKRFYVIGNTSEGTKVLDENYQSKAFGGTSLYNPTDIYNVGNYLNTSYYQGLSQDIKNAIVPNSTWNVGYEGAENQNTVRANIGLLTKSEFERAVRIYGGFLPHATFLEESTLTRKEGFDNVNWILNTESGYMTFNQNNKTSGHELIIRPAMVLKSDLKIDTTTNKLVTGTAEDENYIYYKYSTIYEPYTWEHVNRDSWFTTEGRPDVWGYKGYILDQNLGKFLSVGEYGSLNEDGVAYAVSEDTVIVRSSYRGEYSDYYEARMYNRSDDTYKLKYRGDVAESYRLNEYIGSTEASETAYPSNGYNASDGLWYVRGAKVAPNTAPTKPTLTVPTAQFEHGDQHTLSWNSTDADNNPLTYKLEASYNGGTSWEQLYNGVNKTYNYTVPSNKGTKVQFRVTANDGKVNSVVTTSTDKTIREVMYQWNKYSTTRELETVAETTPTRTTFSAYRGVDYGFSDNFFVNADKTYGHTGTLSTFKGENFPINMYQISNNKVLKIISKLGNEDVHNPVTGHTMQFTKYVVESYNSTTDWVDKQADFITSLEGASNAYVNNAKNSDGFWYVRGSRVLAPNTAPTKPTLTVPTTQFEHGDQHIVSWDATDVDNNPLTYKLEASYNDGASWEQLYNGVNKTYNYTVPSNKGTKVQFRVTANDGKVNSIVTNSTDKTIREVQYTWNKYTTKTGTTYSTPVKTGTTTTGFYIKDYDGDGLRTGVIDSINWTPENGVAVSNQGLSIYEGNGASRYRTFLGNPTTYYYLTNYIGLKTEYGREVYMYNADVYTLATTTGFVKDAFLSTLEAGANSYTNNAKNADGFWYVRGQRALLEDTTPPIIELTEQTTYGAKSKVTVKTHDVGTITTVKWAKGNQNETYFTTGGTAIANGQTTDSSFEVTENGVYTVYAIDNKGNKAVKTIHVTKVNTAPTTPTLNVPTTQFEHGDKHSIAWESTDADNNLLTYKLEATYNGGATWEQLYNGSDTNYLYTVPSNKGTNVKFRVTANDGIINSTVTTSVDKPIRDVMYLWNKYTVKNATSFANPTAMTSATYDFFETGTYTVYEGYEFDSQRGFVGTGRATTVTGRAMPWFSLYVTPNAVFRIYSKVKDWSQSFSGFSNYYTQYEVERTFSESIFAETYDSYINSIQGTANSFVNNAKNSDGFWYMRGDRVVSEDKTPPILEVTEPTTYGTTAVISTKANDTSGVSKLQWKQGEFTKDNFGTGTNVTGNNFTVSDNGKYTVYAEDSKGNKAVKVVDVTKVDKTKPTLTLEKQDTWGTASEITILANDTQSGIKTVKWLSGTKTVNDFASSGNVVLSTKFNVTTNGVYTVYVEDNVGNKEIKTITVDKVDTTAPTVTATEQTTPAKTTTVTITPTDNQSGVEKVEYIKGNYTTATYPTTGTTDITTTKKFTVSENTTYSIRVTDKVGNKTVITTTTSKVDITAPTLNLTEQTTWGEKSKVTVVTSDNLSGVKTVKWLAGTKTVADFVTSGTDITTQGYFEVSTNGVYTTYVEDKAGNTTIKQITVAKVNKAPTVTTVPQQNINGKGKNVTVNLDTYFKDSDGDTLTYTASSSNNSIVLPTVSGNTLTLSGVSKNDATITVVANDGKGGTKTTTFLVKVANTAPTVAEISPQIVLGKGKTKEVSVITSDIDNDSLTLTSTSSNTGIATVAVDNATKKITITGVKRGTATITATINDGTTTTTKTFNVTINNTAPTVINIPKITIAGKNKSQAINLNDYFSDIDSDTLQYKATSSTGNVTSVVSGSTLTLNGIARGTATITVEANDVNGGIVSKEISVEVLNTAPTYSQITNQTIAGKNKDTTLTLSNFFSDLDGDAITYTATSSVTGNVTTEVTGDKLKLKGVKRGNAVITVTANDGKGGTATQTFTTTVINTAPVYTNIPEQTVEGKTKTTEVDVSGYFSDIDLDTLTYTVSSSATGVVGTSLTGTKLKLTGASKGTANITVTANDGNSGTVSQTFKTTVKNTAPVLSKITKQTISGINKSINLTAVATDIDSDVIKYSIVSSDTNKLTATINESTGAIQLSAKKKGDVTVRVTASDGTVSVTEEFTTEILNTAPVLNPIAEQVVSGVGKTTLVPVTVSDVDNDELTLTAVSSNTNIATVSVNNATKQLTITGIKRGSTKITAKVFDGTDIVEREFNIIVKNTAPVINIDTQQVAGEGKTTTLTLPNFVTDIDNDTLTYTVSSDNTNFVDTYITGNSLVLIGIARGVANVTLTANDGNTGVTTKTFAVDTGNTAPIIDEIDNQNISDITKPINLTAKVTNVVNGVTLKYSVASSDASVVGATINENTGAIVLTGKKKGTSTIVVSANNGSTTVTRSFSTKVGNNAPVINTVTPQKITRVGETVSVQVSASDIDDELLDLTAISNDTSVANVTVDNHNKRIDIIGLKKGSTTITARISDGTVVKDTTFVVEIGNTAPTFTQLTKQEITGVGGTKDIKLSDYFSDKDNDTLTYTVVSSTPNVTAKEENGVLKLTGVVRGDSEITVTAKDSSGLTAVQKFVTTVSNTAPTVKKPLQELNITGTGVTTNINVKEFFTDIDSDVLVYSTIVEKDSILSTNVTGDTIALTGVSKGKTELTVIAKDIEGGSVSQKVTVNVGNTAPEAVKVLPNLALTGKGKTEGINLNNYFTDKDTSDVIKYTVISNNNAVGVSVVGNLLTIIANSKTATGDKARITVIAEDSNGATREQEFDVTVNDTAPLVSKVINDEQLNGYGHSKTILLKDLVTDIDGDSIVYEATSSNEFTTVSVQGESLTISGVKRGTSLITVKATSGGKSVSTTFNVHTGNTAPLVKDTVDNKEIENKGKSITFDATDLFKDIDGDALTYTVKAEKDGVILPTVDGNTITVLGVSKGNSDLTITATDELGATVSQKLAVKVGNTAPTFISKLNDLTISSKGKLETVDLNDYFTDSDKSDVIKYTVETENNSITASITGSLLTVLANNKTKEGEPVKVTVTATDNDGSTYEQTFNVNVTDTAPVITKTLNDEELLASGYTKTVLLKDIANDLDGDTITYEATSDNLAVNVNVVDDRLTVTGVREGTATVTVKATSGGKTVTTDFNVSVGNTAPVIQKINKLDLVNKNSTATIDLFVTDTDNLVGVPQNHTITVETSNTNVDATILDGKLHVTGVSKGTSVITVTVNDGFTSVKTSFDVTIGNTAPLFEDIGLKSIDKAGETLVIEPVIHDVDNDRLYLDIIDYDDTVVTVSKNNRNQLTVKGLKRGKTEVTVELYDGTDFVTKTFEVVVGNTAPTLGTVSNKVLNYSGDSTIVAFNTTDIDGDALKVTATPSVEGLVQVNILEDSNEMEIIAIKKGKTNIDLTIDDGNGGKTTKTFQVEVKNTAPTLSAIPHQKVNGVNNETLVDLDIEDTDGDEIKIVAHTENESIAKVEVVDVEDEDTGLSNKKLKLIGNLRGNTQVTVVINDGTENVTRTFNVEVLNTAPYLDAISILDENGTAKGMVDNELTFEIIEEEINLNVDFSDIDKDEVFMTSRIINDADGEISIKQLDNNKIKLNSIKKGKAQLEITLTDKKRDNPITTKVIDIVTKNTAPVLEALEDLEIAGISEKYTTMVELKTSDINNDTLVNTVEIYDLDGNLVTEEDSVTTTIDGNNLTILPNKKGDYKLVVTTDDGDDHNNTDTKEFLINIANTAPVLNQIDNLVFDDGIGSTQEVELGVNDIDNDELTATVEATNSEVLDVETYVRDGKQYVNIKALRKGQSEVKVVLTDIDGLTDTKTFNVVVDNTVPTIEVLSEKTQFVDNGYITLKGIITDKDILANPNPDVLEVTAKDSRGNEYVGEITGESYEIQVPSADFEDGAQSETYTVSVTDNDIDDTEHISKSEAIRIVKVDNKDIFVEELQKYNEDADSLTVNTLTDFYDLYNHMNTEIKDSVQYDDYATTLTDKLNDYGLVSHLWIQKTNHANILTYTTGLDVIFTETKDIDKLVTHIREFESKISEKVYDNYAWLNEQGLGYSETKLTNYKAIVRDLITSDIENELIHDTQGYIDSLIVDEGKEELQQTYDNKFNEIVERSENYLNTGEYTKAQVEINKLPDSDEKTKLLLDLENLNSSAIEYLDTNKDNLGLQELEDLINKLADSPDKDRLQEDLESKINDLITEIDKAKEDGNYQEMQDLINKLPTGTEKEDKETELQEVIDNLVTEIDKAKEDGNYQEMQDLINKLPTTPEKEAKEEELQEIVDEILKDINDAIDNSDVSAIEDLINKLPNEVPNIEDLNTIKEEKHQQLVVDIEQALTDEDLVALHDLINKLPDGEEKDDYIAKLTDLIDKLVEEINDAFSTGNLGTALDLINKLPDTQIKDKLVGTSNNKLVETIEAIEEGFTNGNLGNIQDMINKLPDNEIKEGLLNKLEETIANLITEINKNITDSNATNTEDLINRLPDGATKDELLESLGKVIDNLTTDITNKLNEGDASDTLTLINKLPDGEEKSKLLEEYNKLVEELITTITEGITGGNLTDLQDLINKLPDGDTKDKLQKDYENALNGLETEISLTLEDGELGYAQDLISKLPVDKQTDYNNLYEEALNNVISKVEEAINTGNLSTILDIINKLPNDETKNSLLDQVNNYVDKLLEEITNNLNDGNIQYLTDLIEKLPNGEIKDKLKEDVGNILINIVDEITKAIESGNINVNNLIDRLPEGETKDKLKEMIQDLYDKLKLDANDDIANGNLNGLQDLINSIEDEKLKEELNQILEDVVKDILDEITNNINDENLNNVTDLINMLPDGEIKDEMQEILDNIIKDIVTEVEAIIKDGDLENIYDLINKLPDGEIKDELQELVDNLIKDITKEIEDSINNGDLNTVIDLIDKLPEGTVKDEMDTLLESVINELADAVDKNLADGNIQGAIDLVNKLPDGDKKDELNNLIKDKTDEMLDEINKLVGDKQIDDAINLVNKLPDGEVKDELIKVIDEAVNNVIKDIIEEITNGNLTEAQDLINLLPNIKDKEVLQDELNKKIDEEQTQNDLIKEIEEKLNNADLDIDELQDLINKITDKEQKDELQKELDYIIGDLEEMDSQIDLVTEIEDKLNNKDINIGDLQGLIDSVTDIKEKEQLLEKLKDKINNLLEEAIKQYENSLTTDDYFAIVDLLDKYTDYVDNKQSILDRINEVKEKVNNTSTNTAQELVEYAEKSLNEETLALAQEAVNKLPVGKLKDELNYKLEVLLDKINKEKLYKEALNLVEIAERTKTESDIEKAHKKVTELKPSTNYDNLMARLDKIKSESNTDSSYLELLEEGKVTKENLEKLNYTINSQYEVDIINEALESLRKDTNVTAQQVKDQIDAIVAKLVAQQNLVNEIVNLALDNKVSKEKMTSMGVTDISTLDLALFVGLVQNYIKENGKSSLNYVTLQELIARVQLTKGQEQNNTNISFTDIDNHWSADNIDRLVQLGLVDGGGLFSPNADISRAQYAIILSRTLNLTRTGDNPFKDIEGEWYEDYVVALYEKGMTTGYEDGNYEPMSPVTRQQSMAMLGRLIDSEGIHITDVTDLKELFKDADAVSEYAVEHIEKLVAIEIVEGSEGKLAPKNNLTRGQMAKIVSKAIEFAKNGGKL